MRLAPDALEKAAQPGHPRKRKARKFAAGRSCKYADSNLALVSGWENSFHTDGILQALRGKCTQIGKRKVGSTVSAKGDTDQ
jgi:hypothetical protein